MKKMQPLSLSLIEEGRFVDDINRSIDEAKQKLIAHARKYGESAEGAKAVVNVALTLRYDGNISTPDEEFSADFSVKGAISMKMPGRPAVVTRAVGAEGQTGELELMVLASGSSKDTPHQNKLCTDDGRPIDPETGEVLPLPKGKKKAQE